jgi:hypothetical protein
MHATLPVCLDLSTPSLPPHHHAADADGACHGREGPRGQGRRHWHAALHALHKVQSLHKLVAAAGRQGKGKERRIMNAIRLLASG